MHAGLYMTHYIIYYTFLISWYWIKLIAHFQYIKIHYCIRSAVCGRILNVWLFDNILNNRFSLIVSLFLTDLFGFGITTCVWLWKEFFFFFCVSLGLYWTGSRLLSAGSIQGQTLLMAVIVVEAEAAMGDALYVASINCHLYSSH